MYRLIACSLLASWLFGITVAQVPPHCQPSFNGTVGNGKAGSEQRLNGTTIRKIKAPDANQGVAVDAEHFYSIDNFSITKHRKNNSAPVLQWYGGANGPIIHLDGGVVINGTLFAPHSNYPMAPITSSVEMWDVKTMQHIGSHSFGINRGSMTWLDQHNGNWYGTFANYDRVQPGQTQPYGLTMNTQMVQMNDKFEIVRSWIFPAILYNTFKPMSNSGGSFGKDGWLYITGHDASAAYVIKVPSAGSVLIWVATISLPDIAGQGIAWDRSGTGNGNLWGISRDSLEVVEMRVPTQACGPDAALPVGRVLGPRQFIDPSSD
ncbi:hypothetical protein EJ08DRAFT_98807 [Tothia fuscella]|uniref:Uncharacterized protein n=1 Tax=Tothia fuscella TaxID=1048955 RepID=A0A9P4TSD9_9PEZI|nr:hypothetical protein EJ08DRAFT_98807 [Tothia fuscella]